MFAEEIVSYIYDEAPAKERREFEAHLKNCLMCADELVGFGFVRSSLTEWRNDEVFAIEMPRLENPAIKTSTPVISTTSSSWLDNLRELFAWFPTWKTASVAFAVLIVFAVAMFLVNSPKNNEVASNTKQNGTQNGNKIEEKVSSEVPPQNPQSESIPSNNKPEIAGTVPSKDSAIKASNNSQKQKTIAPKTNETVAQTKDEKKNKNIQKREVPTLTGIDEEEDKSLRLADLFEEIDTK
jgi:hypothetical protein